MKAADTNVVLRLVTGDDPKQEQTARRLLETSGIVISLTVLMETEWVLRSFYRWRRAKTSNVLATLTRLEGVSIERADAALWAIERYRAGADFADMIHLLLLDEVESFATFDGGVARGVGTETPIPVETLR